MKICLVAPGIMPIPPDKWGAVEMMIYDYAVILKELGHRVDIVNTPNRREIVENVNNGDYDIVHVHYDVFIDIVPRLKAKVKIFSSHYPFISYPQQYENDGYHNLIRNIVDNSDFHIFASSQNDIETFIKFGADRNKTFRSKLGVREDQYEYYHYPVYDRTLCFSQISPRKRQSAIQNIEDIDFVGQFADPSFKNLTNYKGEYPRPLLNKEISKYGNFILVSPIENTTPLVVKEALICGLGIVATESVAQELDQSLSFIEIVSESAIQDKTFLKLLIKENRLHSVTKRDEIKKYGEEKFGIRSIIKNEYVPKLESLLNA